jgi:hypothetical protein
VNAATQIYYASFDAVFLKLPSALRTRIEQKIDEIAYDCQRSRITDSKDQTGIAPVSATIEYFTLSI